MVLTKISNYAQNNMIRQIVIIFTMFIIVSIGTVIYQSNNDYRMATVYAGDSYVVHTLVLEHPENYTSDLNAVTLAKANENTLLVIVGRFFYRFFNVHPADIFLFLVILQNFLIVFGLYFFSKQLVGNELLSLVIAFFVLFERAYRYNIAFFNFIQWYPYPGEFALGFMLISAAFFLKQSNIFIFPLFLAGLTHPLQGTYLVSIYFIVLLFQKLCKQENKQFWKTILLLTITFLLFFLPTFLSIFFVKKIEFSGELFNLNLANSHIQTWKVFPENFIKSFIVYFSYGFGAFQSVKYLQKKSYTCFLYGITIVAILFPAFHVLSTIIFSKPVNIFSSLILTRSSQILILLFLPFFFYVFFEMKKGFNFFNKILFSLIFYYFILTPSVVNTALCALLLLTVNLSSKQKIKLMVLLVFIFCFVITNYFVVLIQPPLYLFKTNSLLVLFFLCLIFVLCSIEHHMKKNLSYISSCILIIIFTVNYFTWSFQNDYYKNDHNARSAYEIQMIANNNTKEGTKFIELNSGQYLFKNLSERQVFSLIPHFNIAAYKFPEEVKPAIIQRVTFLANVLGIPKEELFSKKLYSLNYLINKLTKENYKELATTFDVDFVIRDADNLLFDFPVVFKNELYAIQQISDKENAWIDRGYEKFLLLPPKLNNINKLKKPAFYKDYLVGDWIIEEKGAWLREKGSIAFKLKNKPENDLQVTFTASGLVKEQVHPALEVKVFVNNTPITRISVSYQKEYSFVIPKDLLENTDLIDIQFVSTNSKRPVTDLQLTGWIFDEPLGFFLTNYSIK